MTADQNSSFVTSHYIYFMNILIEKGITQISKHKHPNALNVQMVSFSQTA